MQLDPSRKKIVGGMAKGIFHGLASGAAAYIVDMKFLHWLVLATVQLVLSVSMEMEKVIDKLFPDEDTK